MKERRFSVWLNHLKTSTGVKTPLIHIKTILLQELIRWGNPCPAP